MKEAIMILLIVFSAPVAAASSSRAERYFKELEQAKKNLVQDWRDDAEISRYETHALDLFAFGAYLRGRGYVKHDDERLVPDAAKGVRHRNDLGLLGYRIFKSQLRQASGFSPDPKALFTDRAFKVMEINDGQTR